VVSYAQRKVNNFTRNHQRPQLTSSNAANLPEAKQVLIPRRSLLRLSTIYLPHRNFLGIFSLVFDIKTVVQILPGPPMERNST